MRRIIVLAIALIVVCLHVCHASESKTKSDKMILVLHTVKAKQPWAILFNHYLNDALHENISTQYKIEIENLDLIEFSDKYYKQELKMLLEYKYTDRHPDIIIVTFASAIDFLHKNDLFSKVPKILILPSAQGYTNIPNTKVLPFAYDFKGNIEHCIKLLPDLKDIYVVAGFADVDKRTVSLFNEETKELADRVSFTYLTELDIDKLLSRIKDIPQESAVYYLSYSLDSKNNNVIAVEFSEFLGKKADCPVFTYLDLFAIDTGILGGRVTTTRSSATQAAAIVKDVFQGKPIDSIKTPKPYFEYIYDGRELVKYGIDKRKLPSNSIIQSNEFTFLEMFERYRLQILAGIFIVIFQLMLVIFLFINIKKRKSAINALEEARQLLSDAFEYAPIGMLLVNSDGGFHQVNQAFCEMLGYSEDELLKLNFQDITHPDDIIIGRDIVNKLIAGEIRKAIFEKRYVHKHGQIIYTHLSTTLLRDESGSPLYFFTQAQDITSRKKAEEQKARMQLQLQQSQKIEAVGTLAGGIAHDFNNILGVIIGNISYALSSLDKKDDLYKVLSDVQDASKQAQNLTYQLLTFSKGGAPIKKVTDINRMINESALFSISGTTAKCRLELTKDLWTADIDKGQINQVLSNLLINASQAMPNGGVITIQTANSEIEADSGIPLYAGRYVKIAVQDQGVGISKKNLPNIFEPYFTTKQKGSGLGLAISYSIVKKHGGHISVYSEIDKGTVFNIFLPAAAKSIQDIDSIEDKKGSEHAGKGKILLMDDQEDILKMLGRILNRMGYETTSATDGSLAIEIYRDAYQSKEPFDLVILDLTVPGGMGGAKTIPELLKIDPKVKAVVSSGYSNDPIMANYKNYGFCGVIPKPFTKGELAVLFNEIL